MDKFETMSKMELRAACKEAGIKNYGKMNNDGMRAALYEVEVARIQAEAAKNKTTKQGLKIEKDREEQNGIKRPSAGGKCRQIWDALNEYLASTLTSPTAKIVKALAKENGWEKNTANRQFYLWRNFNGIGH